MCLQKCEGLRGDQGSRRANVARIASEGKGLPGGAEGQRRRTSSWASPPPMPGPRVQGGTVTLDSGGLGPVPSSHACTCQTGRPDF